MIIAEALTKSYGTGAILRGVSFSVKQGQVYTLLGPSGCGKTTSMRCIAGLETPDGGRIQLGARTVFSGDQRINLPPDRRNIGMVFQSYAIWPHMTVAQNVAYPLDGRRLSGADLRRRVAQALELVGLGALADRPAPQLSGGQQQRVALARAIVGEPEVLLLDEPLSNLDAKLREQMRRELTQLQHRLGYTMLYVTHDQEEALALSDRLALMRGGEIVEEGEPLSMYLQPRHPFTAAFLGAANFLDCRLTGTAHDGERVEVETVFGRFPAIARPSEDGQSKLFFRPHHTRIHRDCAPQTAGVGHVTEASFLGEMTEIFAISGAETVRLRMLAAAAPKPGEAVTFSLDPEYGIAFLPGLSGRQEPRPEQHASGR